ncbi:uncharacterized protein LOC130698646 [Daphnia carinata]|uniref:uncharacterized protein LOC130698646 n=1 Tax=Daphnia carinata TaxID=120202 RepID=UPI0025797E8C|nr:uncharacterized protein LOC130698646 [Daphnia carinata]
MVVCITSSNKLVVAFSSVLLFVVIFSSNIVNVDSHGYMYDPPGRSSMWRVGFSVPEDSKNYNDMELNCGGREAQHNSINQGRCGECGDEWRLERPRSNDEGGIYHTGIIGQTYTEGSVVRITVNVTANHWGDFVFRLCPKQSADELVTQECLDRYPLELVELPGQGDAIVVDGGTKFQIGSSTGLYFPTVRLPAGVTCQHCVLQWYWTVANSEGLCPNGGSGYCYQESFVNCADVSILPARL